MMSHKVQHNAMFSFHLCFQYGLLTMFALQFPSCMCANIRINMHIAIIFV